MKTMSERQPQRLEWAEEHETAVICPRSTKQVNLHFINGALCGLEGAGTWGTE